MKSETLVISVISQCLLLVLDYFLVAVVCCVLYIDQLLQSDVAFTGAR